MKENKKTKIYANYFTKTDNLKIAGIIILIASGVEFFFGWSYIGYIISSVGLIAGIVMFIVGSSGRISEAEISEYISKHTDTACTIDAEEKALAKRVRKTPTALIAEGFVFSSDVMIRKTKKGSLNSSIYSKAILYPLDTALLIRRRTLLIADEKWEDASVEIAYSDIARVEFSEEIVDIPFGKKLFRAKNNNIVIMTKDGNSISVTAQDNVEVDTFIKEITAIISQS